MNDFQDRPLGVLNGFLMILVEILVVGMGTLALTASIPEMEAGGFPLLFLAFPLAVLFLGLTVNGFFLIHPNEAKVFLFFGKYCGTAREPGFFWTNPLTQRRVVSLRVRNFNSQAIKVNDASGNPIEIAAVVVWKVTDPARAVFDVENYENFVNIQSETAIRHLANHFPYDVADGESLRGNPEQTAEFLKGHLKERLVAAGVGIIEARLSHLAYAPEIAQVMLRRQQAQAIIAARRLIVEGAVGMVELALSSLEAQGVVRLDEEKKAAMVNNLLVALVSDSEVQPVINTGTLYT